MTFGVIFFLCSSVYSLENERKFMNEISEIIADKIVWHTLNEADERKLQEWLALSEENRMTFERAKNGELTAIVLRKDKEKFGQKMSQRVLMKLGEKRKQIRTKRILFWSSVAALLTLSFLLYTGSEYKEPMSVTNPVAAVMPELKRDEVELITSDGTLQVIEKSEILDSILSNRMELTKLQEATAFNTIIVPRKKVFNMILPDGTKVWLNAGSKLIFPTQFSDTLRRVELVGEAFFEVVKNRNAPFVVKTKMLETKVLGTKFMVTSYDDTLQSEIALVEGRVNVSSTEIESGTILNAGESLSYDLGTNNYKKNNIDIHDIINRTSELFIFDDISLVEIAKSLSRWYGVEFEFSDTTIQQEIFYLKSFRYDTIDEILTLLKNTKKIDYTIEKNRVKIKSLLPM